MFTNITVISFKEGWDSKKVIGCYGW